MERSQLNLRISDALGKMIDAKRIELASTLGHIPSRSDILRFALEKYLDEDLSKTEGDRRRREVGET
jgi:Arc/MetJ-type ribon-helix-helix transcriptional regulator